MSDFERDVVVVGGCGRVGLPLAVAFASRGLRVGVYDLNKSSVDTVNAGVMPFDEPGAPEVLRAVAGRNLVASAEPDIVASAQNVVFVVGTPLSDHLTPALQVVPAAVDAVVPSLRDGQLVVLRSTVYPGVTKVVARHMGRTGLDVDVAFCPERIAEGKAMEELFDLPQIVSGMTPRAVSRAAALFGTLTEQTVELDPHEAELAKLFTNAWRYLKFAGANQFFEIANDFGVDYERIRQASMLGYPRLADLPGAGFAAGPCLVKDTMQLAAFVNHNFALGHASMMVNEGLPLYVADKMAKRWDLSSLTIGILGMAFKAESDDPRDSLSYKLRQILAFNAHAVVCTDPYVSDETLVPLDDVLAVADILVIGTPHRVYADLQTDKPVVDIWGLVGGGVKV